MDAETRALIAELYKTAEQQTAEYMADPNNANSPDRKVEDHVCYRAAVWLAAIFEPKNQPSQFGTVLVNQ